MIRTISLLIVTLLSGQLLTVRSVGQEPPTSIWDGIYTTDQAARGAEVFNSSCVSCHGADLRGSSNAASLRGVSFMFLWEGRSVGELFEIIKTRMPTENPASLSASAYLDALSYILQVNNFPSGNRELMVNPQQLNSLLITPAPP